MHDAVRLPRVVHLSGDFPDSLSPNKSRVVENLLALTADRFDHQAISINRRSPRWSAFAASALRHPVSPRLRIETQSFPQGTALTYSAPPNGLYHATMLRQLGDWLAIELASDPPDLLVGHKLTIEGIAVARAARALGIPYALTLQGKTDARLVRIRSDLAEVFRSTYHQASAVFALTPWVVSRVEEVLGPRRARAHLVPAPSELDEITPPRTGGNGLISMFHLHNWRGKNLRGMLCAHRAVVGGGLPVPLTILGGGSADELAECRAMARSNPLVSFPGNAERDTVRGHLNSAIGFVMPSIAESFGLVFIEALFAGTPIVYPQGQAVSGYFDGAPFAVAVDARDPRAIADAMGRLVREERSLKAALADWQRSADARRFTRPAIGTAFAAGMGEALGRDQRPREMRKDNP